MTATRSRAAERDEIRLHDDGPPDQFEAWARSLVASGPSRRLVQLVEQSVEQSRPAPHYHFFARLIVRADRDPSWSRKGTCRRRAAILRDLAVALRDGAGQVAADTGRLDVLSLVADFVGRHLTEAK